MSPTARYGTVVLIACLVLVAAATWRQREVTRLSAAAELCYRNGALSESLALSLKALRLKPGDASIFYNAGCAHLQLGNYGQAIQNLETAVLKARHSLLRSQAHYNLGIAWYREAQKSEAQGTAPADLKDLYGRSLENFRCALQWDSSNQRAALGVELIKRRLMALSLRARETTDVAPAQLSPGDARSTQATAPHDSNGSGRDDSRGQPHDSKDLQVLPLRDGQTRMEEPIATTTRSFAPQRGRDDTVAGLFDASLSRSESSWLGEAPLNRESSSKVLQWVLDQEMMQRHTRKTPTSAPVDLEEKAW